MEKLLPNTADHEKGALLRSRLDSAKMFSEVGKV